QLDDQTVAITPEAETGLILVDIPAGQHTLTIHFGETPLRAIALGLTGVTIIGLAVVGIISFVRSQRVRASGPGQTEQQTGPGKQSDKIAGYAKPDAARLRLGWFTSGIIILIFVAALWAKPLLQPLFTVESPTEQALPAQHQLDVRFANGIQLVGYSLSQRQVAPGGYLQ
ncbi:MAG: hypothetical protein GY796_03960, partial [Chloroflexi bacterium]|nr:hypothetical protein [Chloroflexota bacterium]